MTTTTLEAPKPIALPKRIPTQKISLAETARNVWRVEVPAEHTEEDCISPAYLWLRHDLLKPGDRAEMVHEDYKFLIEVLIVKIDRDTQSVFTRIINAVDFSDQPIQQADLSQAVIEKSGADGWRVVLGNVVLSRGHERKPDAEAWLAKRRGEAV